MNHCCLGSGQIRTKLFDVFAKGMNYKMSAINSSVVSILPLYGVERKNSNILFMKILASIIYLVINCSLPTNMCISFLLTSFGIIRFWHSAKISSSFSLGILITHVYEVHEREQT